jgi:hypothetical protein
MYAPVKNKLVGTANFSVKKNIGNVPLSLNILNNITLKDIYLNRNQRKNLASNLSKSLKMLKDVEEGKQCKDELVKHIEFKKVLGSGTFGEVSVGSILLNKIQSPRSYNKKFNFAIKMSHMPAKIAPYIELHIGRLLNKLVFEGKAQNLPVIIDSYKCDSCQFKAKSIGNKTKKCLFTINEIASMDLASWLQNSPSRGQLESCLFQIMAGIHAYQHHYLILNNDIKAPNILVYEVNPGGYWKYTIYGRDFYVPNYGQLFIVNDYGVASIYSPKYQVKYDAKNKEIELGYRAFMINNGNIEPFQNQNVPEKKGKKWSQKAEINGVKIDYLEIGMKKNKIDYPPILTEAQKKIIGYDSSNLKFYDSNLVPSLDFMIDTQDAIRLLLGLKRMSQGFIHEIYNIDMPFRRTLLPYTILNISFIGFQLYQGGIKVNKDNLQSFFAGFFILDYFTKVVNYTVPKHKDHIISHIKTS